MTQVRGVQMTSTADFNIHVLTKSMPEDVLFLSALIAFFTWLSVTVVRVNFNFLSFIFSFNLSVALKVNFGILFWGISS